MRQYLSFVGLALNTIGSYAYLRDTLRGTTRPNRVSFVLWTLAPMIAFFVQVQQGVGWSSVATFAAGLEPGLILAASFVRKDGYWQLGSLDYFCAVLSVLALVLWWITGSGDIAILFTILTDFFASVPTMVKAYRAPETETGWTYAMSSLSGLTGLLSVTAITFAAIAFPLYLMVAMGTIAGLALVSGRRTQQGGETGAGTESP